MPVRGVNGVEDVISVFILLPVSVFVQDIFPALFVAPGTVRIQRTHGRHHMEVRIRDAVITFVRFMDSQIRDHPFIHQAFLYECPSQFKVFFRRKLILKRDIKAVRQLRLLVFLHFLHRIPECLPVFVFRRRVRRQHDLRIGHAAFAGEIVGFPVVLAVQFFSRAVGGGRDGALTACASDMAYMEMTQCHISPPPSPEEDLHAGQPCPETVPSRRECHAAFPPDRKTPFP